MRYYTFTDLMYRESIKNLIVPVTAVNSVTAISPPSKELFLRNDGPNYVYLEFDGDVASSTTSFKFGIEDGPIKVPAQCVKLAAVCAAGESASLRVGIHF